MTFYRRVSHKVRVRSVRGVCSALRAGGDLLFGAASERLETDSAHRRARVDAGKTHGERQGGTGSASARLSK